MAGPRHVTPVWATSLCRLPLAFYRHSGWCWGSAVFVVIAWCLCGCVDCCCCCRLSSFSVLRNLKHNTLYFIYLVFFFQWCFVEGCGVDCIVQSGGCLEVLVQLLHSLGCCLEWEVSFHDHMIVNAGVMIGEALGCIFILLYLLPEYRERNLNGQKFSLYYLRNAPASTVCLILSQEVFPCLPPIHIFGTRLTL